MTRNSDFDFNEAFSEAHQRLNDLHGAGLEFLKKLDSVTYDNFQDTWEDLADYLENIVECFDGHMPIQAVPVITDILEVPVKDSEAGQQPKNKPSKPRAPRVPKDSEAGQQPKTKVKAPRKRKSKSPDVTTQEHTVVPTATNLLEIKPDF